MKAIVLNIEQFHSVNALYGRDFGDQILNVISSEISIFLSEQDGIAQWREKYGVTIPISVNLSRDDNGCGRRLSADAGTNS